MMCCFLFLLTKNETANSGTNCKLCCKNYVKRTAPVRSVNNDQISNEVMQYDGFFIKL